ncbi:MAG: alpha/beta hydrolase [Bacteroidales bacterium]|nr:alpha/beta hydrolase [Lentimicrobiaceae bacterium]MDD5695381.1 alpha/beta hydrolase [Bacteroidales bacterium]
MKIDLQRCKVRWNPVIAASIFLVIAACDNQQGTTDDGNTLIGEAASSDQVRIDYRVSGTNHDTTLIFIHEWLCDQTYWQNQVGYFSGRYRVVTLDLAGHGRSGDNRQKYTLDLYADDVIAVMKKIRARKVYLIGHSFGANVAVKVALKVPKKVIAILSVDSFANLTQDYPESEIENKIRPYQQDFRTSVKKHASLLFGNQPDSTLVRRVVNDWASADSSMAITSMVEYLRFKPSVWTKELTAPVYALNAAKFPANARGNQGMLKSYKMYLLPRVGHFPQLEDPGYFNEVVKTILQESSQKPKPDRKAK